MKKHYLLHWTYFIQMRSKLFLILTLAIIFSCNRKEPYTSPQVPAHGDLLPLQQDSTAVLSDSHYYWTFEIDQKDGLLIKKLSPLPVDSLTPLILIHRMNEEYPEIKLKYVRVANDTIFVRIERSSFLTEQLGSTGAPAYLGVVTYNLTELSGINNVDIYFKAGDHASPDTYSRTDFIHEAHR